MKVLLTHRPGGAYGYISDGWLNAFQDKGHEVQRWDGLIPTWAAFKPDLYIGCSGHKQPIPANRNLPNGQRTKVAIHVNPYGPINIPGINESAENIIWSQQYADVVFGYGCSADELMWRFWPEKTKIPWVPMPTAGDKVRYYINPSYNREYDLVYLGGRWKYKGENIDKFLLPVLRKKYNTAIFGWGGWPDDIKSTVMPEDDHSDRDLYNSGKLAPCVCEPHTTTYGIDIPERFFKAALCGCLPILDPVPAFRNNFVESAIVAEGVDHYALLIQQWLNDPRREVKAEEIRQEVLQKHTYHHRLGTLLRALGFHDEAARMIT